MNKLSRTSHFKTLTSTNTRFHEYDLHADTYLKCVIFAPGPSNYVIMYGVYIQCLPTDVRPIYPSGIINNIIFEYIIAISWLYININYNQCFGNKLTGRLHMRRINGTIEVFKIDQNLEYYYMHMIIHMILESEAKIYIECM